MMTLRLEFVPKNLYERGAWERSQARFFAAIFRWLVSYSTS